jgi:cell division protein FtsB
MLRRRILPLLPFCAAAYYLFFGGVYSMADLRDARLRVEETREAMDALAAETRRLEARAEALATDPWTLERIARERFGMIRPGETLYRFTEPVRAGGMELDTGDAAR